MLNSPDALREFVAIPSTKLLYEYRVRDESTQMLLRSKMRAVSRRMGFSDTVREKMELVCNELTSNQMFDTQSLEEVIKKFKDQPASLSY